MFKVISALVVAILFCSMHVHAMDGLKKVNLTEDYIEDNRKEIVSTMLELDETQMEELWPLYEEYRSKMNSVNEGAAKTIQVYLDEYEDLSEDQAINLLSDYIDSEEDRIIYKKLYLAKFMEIIPPKKAALLYQMENKMAAVVKFGLAAKIPLIKATENGTVDFNLNVDCLTKE